MTNVQTIQDGFKIDFTAGKDYDAGEVRQHGNGVGIVLRKTKNGERGTMQMVGVYGFPREQDTAFTAGQPAWWNSAATPEGGAATGAAVNNDGGGLFPFIGHATDAAADSAAVTEVNLKLAMPAAQEAGATPTGGVGELIVIRKAFADAAGDTGVFGTAGAPVALTILDVLVENRAANGANANTIQVCKAAAGASAVSDAISLNAKVDTDLVRAAKIDDANAGIAKGGALYLNAVKAGGTMGGMVSIFAVRA